ncbi:MAG TPA: GNAT family N-acetyltransferase [Candidatus Limnocylindria bacterium]|nr:GNAT family N-acetyltransferase [Candidatus Limnocylindria bacterium]
MNEMTTRARPIGPRRVAIDDGRWVSIRPIERSDAPGLSDFYARLSPDSRRRRFLGSAPGLDGGLLHAFTEDGQGFVGILGERGPRDGAVVAHASVQAVRGAEAEMAFTVADELQGRGIGRELLSMALELAEARGLTTATLTLLAENVPMRRLVQCAGRPIVADDLDAGVEEITLRLMPAA